MGLDVPRGQREGRRGMTMRRWMRRGRRGEGGVMCLRGSSEERRDG